ncbi:HugZ family protein [Rhizobium sp. WL3]|uniref:HugZ family pyridoxamine 5'-phosphate oxidase n=1 Tax=Rhizobium sp. WL3 TaxID=2603277 RepID=UPI0011C1F599|nr:pyridoxamine 5'-phosphate oxidase family protein [Rhizobium sp. WL3]QEE44586.1 HugZ family protein [Rhizobium sp. WL3]
MNDKPQVIRDTDDDARRQARILLRGARFAAIGVLDPETGFPFVSRVLLGMDHDGAAVILVSGLSAHTTALLADARASLLTGEPAKGDPLAHPRLTLQCTAESVERDSETHLRLRTRFLARHPKSQLYIDFPDFRFFRLRPERASLNGGFGRAYHLSSNDFFIPKIDSESFADEQALLRELGGRHPDLARRLATKLHGATEGDWRISAVDSHGTDIVFKDLLIRHEFVTPITNAQDLLLELPNSVYAVP